jgi:hypothetical protein
MLGSTTETPFCDPLVSQRERCQAPTLDSVTIELPEDVASRLAEIAAAQHKNVAQIAAERLRSFETSHNSPANLLALIRGLPRPSGAVGDLEGQLAPIASRLLDLNLADALCGIG